ncbi:hypothetical protein SAMN05720470_10867 [Fibrobacter sp. UWOV1]|uniref:hypothetical protein n=1 Tax=Fibrobacter sp. UWOV1 TaxID=1896215 RepID=UPI000924888C|nr:hypothetical protein [Fibrobacter sp. UWOV1]SHL43249.1 hypothetical protein SAMN05720470_10867 [Fibrobacter sp. UWOV1]
MVYNDNEKEYASKGVGTAGLTTGIIGTVGTAIATGLLGGNGGLGGLFGGNQNPAASPVYQLSQKDNEIALLKAQQYSDNKTFALAERVANLETKVVAIETAAPLRDKILSDSILSLQRQMSEISVRRVPNYVLDPGYGPAFVAPMPPPFPPVVQNGTTSTPATQTTAQAA